MDNLTVAWSNLFLDTLQCDTLSAFVGNGRQLYALRVTELQFYGISILLLKHAYPDGSLCSALYDNSGVAIQLSDMSNAVVRDPGGVTLFSIYRLYNDRSEIKVSPNLHPKQPPL